MFFKSLWKALVWAILIMIVSAIPGQVMEPYAIWNADKIVHVGIYFILTVLIMNGLKKQTYFPSLAKRALLISVVFSICYGGIIEALQENCFINRSGNWPDFTANSIGAIVAVFVFPYIKKLGLRIKN
ncbi:MAG: VanZ family protein [Bacteroidia bacterium]|nr:VanZ family protein [Bacteroidia bacterium]